MLDRFQFAFPVKAALLAVIVVAFIVRVGVLLADPKPTYLIGLTAWQTEMARNIVDHGRWFVVDRTALFHLQGRQTEAGKLLLPSPVDFSSKGKHRDEPEVLEMPGLAVVDAAVWSVTDAKSYSTIRWIQILLDVAMVALIFWIGVTLTRSDRVGLLAAAGYALWPGAAVLAKTPSLDTWATFFTIGALALFLWAREGGRRSWRLVAFGLLIGIGLYFRPFLIVLAPWTIRNAYEFGQFIPTRTSLGQALWMGLGETPNDFGAVNNDVGTTNWVHRSHPELQEGTPEFDNFLLHRALSAIKDEPLHYLALVARRSLYLLPCALALLWWRRWPRERLILVAVAFSLILPYVFMRMEDRFWLPAIFTYLLLAAMVVECALRARVSESTVSASHP